MFGLQNDPLKDKVDHSLIGKDTWRSYESMWDPYLRVDVLSLAFFVEDSLKNFMILVKSLRRILQTISSLGWKQIKSLCRNEPFYIYSHEDTRNFIREACYAARVGAKIQQFNSSLYRIFNISLESCEVGFTSNLQLNARI